MEDLFKNYNKDDVTNGLLLLIDKPYNWSSFDVVNKIRLTIKSKYRINKIKVGHAGTLDPLATGLLLVCTGKMTKKISELQNQLKIYTGTFILGSTTPSFDLETKIDTYYSYNHINEHMINKILSIFIGEINQTPPIYSAIKKDGKRLYKLARQGKKIKIKSRKVLIKKFEITRFKLPELDFLIECSKGTYIRSIANDFGKVLKSGAHIKNLRRIASGDYKINKAFKI